MTYHAAIGPRLAASIGIQVPSRHDPHLSCDGCGVTQSVLTQRGDVSSLWLRKRTLKGWHTTRIEDDDGSVTRIDYCPKCRAEKKEPSR